MPDLPLLCQRCNIPAMAWFTEDAIEFFRELELNNNRDWFMANKSRYEKSVKGPMEAFAAEMGARVKQIEPSVSVDPKKAVFRIYRDTRFAKDKTPYKTNAGMLISGGPNLHTSRTGLYFHFDARSMGMASGMYSLEPPQLKAVRRHIAVNPTRFNELLQEAAFVEAFGGMRGEKNKIAPAEFKGAAAEQPLILNKQFYYWAEFEAEDVLREDLPELLISRLHAAIPMNEFLAEAFG